MGSGAEEVRAEPTLSSADLTSKFDLPAAAERFMEDPEASHQALRPFVLSAEAKVGGVGLGIYDRPTSLLGIPRGTAM